MKLKLADLVLDYDLYPRHAVDSTHVKQMVEALEAGVTLPPIIADNASRRVTDGFHRYRAYARFAGEDADVNVTLRKYDDEASMFEDAMRLNAVHGHNLTPFDRARCVQRSEELGIDPSRLASALNITTEKITDIKMTKYARSNGNSVLIKRTIRHLAGQQLSPQQMAAKDRVGGLSQVFYVNQVINLIEGDLLDPNNESLFERLQHLRDLLGSVAVQAS